jgi:RES domain-containing protein
VITSWRIVTHRREAEAFTGEGAARYPGRWNLRGTPVVYTAQSAALAALEMLVHIDSEAALSPYVLFACSFSEELIEAVDPAKLPRRWKDAPARPELRQLGDDWLTARRSAVLQVPSAIVPSENNYLLNPLHPDFPKIKIADPVAFALDMRLVIRR